MIESLRHFLGWLVSSFKQKKEKFHVLLKLSNGRRICWCRPRTNVKRVATTGYPGWRKPAGNLFLEPIFAAVYFFTVSLPFCGRRGKGLPRTGQNVQSFAKPKNAVK